MSTLIEKIKEDRMVAFKNRTEGNNMLRKDLLGCLITDATKATKEPDDKSVLGVIKKFIEGAEEVKKSTDSKSYEHYKADQEIKILEAYRPQQMSEDEIKEAILVIPFTGDPNMKEAMQFFKTNYENQYDAALVSKLVREIL